MKTLTQGTFFKMPCFYIYNYIDQCKVTVAGLKKSAISSISLVCTHDCRLQTTL